VEQGWAVSWQLAGVRPENISVFCSMRIARSPAARATPTRPADRYGRTGSLVPSTHQQAERPHCVRAFRGSVGLGGPGKQGRDDEGAFGHMVRDLELQVHGSDLGGGEDLRAVVEVA
jgi:hypothetical protein